MFRRFVVAIAALMLALMGLPAVGTAAPRPQNGIRGDQPADAVPGQLLIKFAPGTASNARQDVVRAAGGQFVRHLEGFDTDLATFPALKNNNAPDRVIKVINNLKRNPNVEIVEPNYIYKVNFTPNDPSLSQQYGWTNTKAYQAWDVTQGSASTVIGIVDTGIAQTHSDLDAKIVAGYDYVQNDSNPEDGNGHGTHVAGTSAAETNNTTSGAGMCPGCKLMGVRVLDANGSGSLDNVALGIRYAADRGVKVINLSLGGPGSTTLQSAVDYAWGKGVFLACAAGNDGTSSTASAYPGAYGNCFAVASTTSTDAISSFSNYGTWVEAAAPGSNIYSTWLSNGYNTISGTSMATPHVAGLAGLLASQGLTNAQIRDRICSTSDKITGTASKWTCGRINAYAAVTGGTTSPTPTPAPSPTPSPSGNVISNGGFESGTSPWVQSSSGGYQLIDATRPRSGSYSAYLAGYNNANDTLYQTVTVPASGVLRYYYYISTSETGTTAYDYLRVRVYNTSGTLLATLKTYSNASTKNAWVADSASMASYAGQTVRVQFSATTDASLTSSFFVDDVSLQP